MPECDHKFLDTNFCVKCGISITELRTQIAQTAINVPPALPTTQRIYAGVGSRETPEGVLLRMTRIARRLNAQGWLLRTGGADGADMAFQSGCDATGHPERKELMLPWQGFNGHSSKYCSVSEEAKEIAQSVIPWWPRLNRAARLLHGRNAYQVLGYDLKSPSNAVICWTPKGKAVGGTRTALMLAEKFNIPVYNLALLPDDEWLDRLLPNGLCKCGDCPSCVAGEPCMYTGGPQ